MLIYAAINEIMRAVPSISKYRKNEQQGYSFRGIDDIYNALNEHLAMSRVFVTSEVLTHEREERATQRGGALIYSIITVKFTFHAQDGSSVTSTIIGEGMDSGDKASNKAMSTAYKYAFLQLFCIPTEDPKDSENDSHEVKAKADAYIYKPAKNYVESGQDSQDEKQWLNLLDKDGNVRKDKRHLIEGEIDLKKLAARFKINKKESEYLQKLTSGVIASTHSEAQYLQDPRPYDHNNDDGLPF